METLPFLPGQQSRPRMFSNPFSFKGRIRRLEYGLSFIIFYAYLLVVSIAIGLIAGAFNASDGIWVPLIYLNMTPAYWFLWAQGAKRCHDLGNSGWWQIVPFYIFWMLFQDGETGDNNYGPNPKGIK